MELARSTSRGGLSLRSIFMFALAVLFTAFLWTISASPATHAADASWSGSAITYDGNKYNLTDDKVAISAAGLDSASQVYVFVDPDLSNGTFNTTSGTSPPSDRKIRFIYFEANVDSSTATEAKYKDLTFVSKGQYTNPSGAQTITFTQTGAQGSTSCDVDTGLGWIICPVTTTLATAMDSVYTILTGFLEVRPIETGQDNALYRAWKYMQAIANVAFVIVFLIIIYSQITNAGISSYGLKKLLPRLIIAAVLVNMSYFISSIAVDVSNILGYSLQDIFISMRNNLVGSQGNGWDLISWESISGFVLSGGTLAAAGVVGLATVADLGIGVLWLLLPALLVALMAVLVALVVLAARQAIIIILVILSPLAFVAYLLPNTEKWFGKWRDTFFTMLFIFPAFSVIFGGSQLAATAIIQTADSINLVILGMLVQVAPLFITPLLIKLGGGLLGRIAGLINDPNKGIIDRTRNMVKDRTDDARARRLGTDAKKWQLMKRNAQFRYNRRTDREKWRAAHTGRAEANWAGRTRAVAIDNYGRDTADIKTLNETRAENLFAASKLVQNSPRQLRDIDVRNAKIKLDNTNKRVEDQYNKLQAKDNGDGLNVIPTHLATRAVIARTQAHKASTIARQAYNTDYMVKSEYAKALAANETMRRQAGGINPRGANSALAAAFAVDDEAYGKAIAEGRAINEHFKLSSSETQRHATMRSVLQEFSKVDDDGNVHWFTVDDVFTRQAALEDMVAKGTADEAEEIFKLSGLPEFEEYRSTIGNTMAKSPGMQAKLLYAAGQTIDDFKQGRIVGDDGLDFAAARSILKGKFSEGEIVGLDPTAIRRLHAVMSNEGGRGQRALERLFPYDPSASPEEQEARIEKIADYERLRKELSTDVRKTFFGDKKGDIKSGARPGLVDIARLEKEEFDLDDKETWGDDVEGAPAKGALDAQKDDLMARSIMSGLEVDIVRSLDAGDLRRLMSVALDEHDRGKNARGRVMNTLTDQAIYDTQLEELSKKIRDAMAQNPGQISDEVREDLLKLARLTSPNFDPNDRSTW